MNTKRCRKCLEDLPIEDFYDKPRGLFGKDSQCMVCRKIYQRNYKWRVKYSSQNALLIFISTVSKIGIPEIVGPSKKAEYVWPRMIFVVMMSELHYSYETIAKIINRKDHTSVIHYLTTHQNLMDSNLKEYVNLFHKIRDNHQAALVMAEQIQPRIAKLNREIRQLEIEKQDLLKLQDLVKMNHRIKILS